MDAIRDIVSFSAMLDFDRRCGFNKRLSRQGDREIEIVDRKQLTNEERLCVLWLCSEWDFGSASGKLQTKLAQAACALVSFDKGLAKPVGSTQVKVWYESMREATRSGINLGLPNQSGRKKGKYLDLIEKQYPGYVYELYRYATRMRGVKASWQLLAEAACFRSRIPTETRPDLKFVGETFRIWFIQNGGIEKKVVTRPILPEGRKRDRVEWAIQRLREDIQDGRKRVYLDEKWMLDLGVWCSLQSMVELNHRKKCKSNRDALARTIEDVWQQFPAEKFRLVHERWLKVLKIICNSKGDNVKSDAFRGKSVIPEVDLDALQREHTGNVIDIDVDSDSDVDVEDD